MPEQCLDDVDGAMISALNPLKKADFLVAKATVAGMLIILICNVGMLIVFFLWCLEKVWACCKTWLKNEINLLVIYANTDIIAKSILIYLYHCLTPALSWWHIGLHLCFGTHELWCGLAWLYISFWIMLCNIVLECAMVCEIGYKARHYFPTWFICLKLWWCRRCYCSFDWLSTERLFPDSKRYINLYVFADLICDFPSTDWHD